MEELVTLRARRESLRFERLREEDRAPGFGDRDVEALRALLERRIRGTVRFDAGYRALYATDGSNYRQVPIGVVVPSDVDDVVETIACARELGAPILSRGGGTSLAGQCTNVALVIDFSKHLDGLLEIDPVRRLARVEPGCVLDRLRHAATREHGLNFGPDPATHTHCTLGGMLGNNSCGIHSLLSVKHGLGHRTSDNTHELEILTYDGVRMRVGATSPEELEYNIRAGGRRGQIYERLRALRDRYADEIRERFPKLPRRVSGYNLDELLPENGFHLARALVGSESTCVTILEATVQLVPEPKARTLVMLGYPDVYAAGDDVAEILEFQPIGLEGIDDLLVEFTRNAGGALVEALGLLPEGKGFLFVELGGESKADSDEQARRMMRALSRRKNAPSMRMYDDKAEEQLLWDVREGALGSTAWVKDRRDNWPGWEDSAVPVERVGDYLRDLKGLMRKYDFEPSLYGHLGQGCIHCRIPFDLYTAGGVQTYRNFVNDAADLVVSHGGSLSGEHGDGQSRGELLPKMFGPRLMEAFREFKAIWDPDGRMNPGKVVDALPITADLRLGADYSPPQPETHFSYPEEGGFSRAALRCVGVGKCRRESGGVMCPSYMVTKEEMHSTRGRARLLFEMLNGEVVSGGWRSEAVKEALDLCLACKGCKTECPVNVDMATYKAEFLSHYYAGRLRPRNAYAFGFVHWWSRLAARVPVLTNALTHLPGVRRIAKWLAGMAQARDIPRFAPETFRSWFERRERPETTAPRVLLFTDTFNDHFHVETAKSAVRVLEEAGFSVAIPAQDVCCGRPLYDYGFVETANAWLQTVLDVLRPELISETPIVVLEPSCASVFRDEAANLAPTDKDAQRLRDQTFTLSELLEKRASHFELPRLEKKALVQAHCHHRTVLGFEEEKRVLERMGVEVEMPDSGCCGMAGAFGMEAGERHEVSVECGRRALIPAVEAAPADTLIVADGFSCREQIRQMSDRSALHLADVIAAALDDGPIPPRRNTRPEAEWVTRVERAHAAANKRAAVRAGSVAAGAILGFVTYRALARRR